MKKSLLELTELLKEEDLIALSHLYLYRAMDVEQIFNFIYKVPGDTHREIKEKELSLENA